MTNPVSTAANGKNITSTTTVYTGDGAINNIFVSSSSSGTIKISDGTTTLVNTFSAVAATNYVFGFRFSTSLIITVGGTLDCCVGWST